MAEKKKLKYLQIYEDFKAGDDVVKTGDEPLGLAVLGAPAGGKSYNKDLLTKNLKRLQKTSDPRYAQDLTVDILRGRIQDLPAIEQLKLFYWGYFTMKELAEEDEKTYGKWFNNMKDLWEDKLSNILSSHDVSVDIDKEGNLLLDNDAGWRAIKALEKIDSEEVIDKLDDYQDYKRVVRAYQLALQNKAAKKHKDVIYDESGDEPEKILNNMNKLHHDEYITDIVMIHHKDVANNLLQNAGRIITGNDGGRDSSRAIIQAYQDIEAGLDDYKDQAEVAIDTKTEDLPKAKGKAAQALKQATTADDKDQGDKPIDVFIRVMGDDPIKVYERITKQLDEEQKETFKALLVYQTQDPDLHVPSETQQSVADLVNMSNDEALSILDKANSSKKFKFQYGGIDDKLLSKAKKVLK